MIDTIKGNLLNVKQGIIVHGCNALGVMGAGIAAAIREKWPKHCKPYFDLVKSYGSQSIGTIAHSWIVPDQLVLVHAITQPTVSHEHRAVSYDAVAECFGRISVRGDMIHLPLCFPLLGAGLGGGNWRIISVIIDEQCKRHRKMLYVL